jgi:hypothetical protein
MPNPVKSSLPKLFRTDELNATFGTVLGYGPAGAGKTRSIKTLKDAGMSPVILATELGETAGLLSVKNSGIPFIPIANHGVLVDVIAALGSKPGKVEYEQQEFGCVVLDSITQWGEMPLDRFVQLKGWTDLHGMEERGKDPRAAYGFLAEKGRQLYKALFRLHAHLYLIAREGVLVVGEGKEREEFHVPDLPGQKLPREVPGWPDATIRLRVVGGQHVMVTKGEGGSPARVRLPESFEDLPLRCQPNIAALIQYMCGDRTAIAKLKIPAKQGASETKNASTASVGVGTAPG